MHITKKKHRNTHYRYSHVKPIAELLQNHVLEHGFQYPQVSGDGLSWCLVGWEVDPEATVCFIKQPNQV